MSRHRPILPAAGAGRRCLTVIGGPENRTERTVQFMLACEAAAAGTAATPSAAPSLPAKAPAATVILAKAAASTSIPTRTSRPTAAP
jgi:hypothetical protein